MSGVYGVADAAARRDVAGLAFGRPAVVKPAVVKPDIVRRQRQSGLANANEVFRPGRAGAGVGQQRVGVGRLVRVNCGRLVA